MLLSDFSMSEHIMEIDGLTFRDLDHDGELAPYEDHRRPVEQRVSDLLGRMTLEEKVGLMMHGTAQTNGPLGEMGVGDQYDLTSAQEQILGKSINHLITRLNQHPEAFAKENNQLQAIAARGRLGIPLTISTDPRHHFQHVTGASSRAMGFSQWPETTGLAATQDSGLVRQFADIARMEYRAVGIHMALSPQADIATEPRWSRISGTFGEDPDLARQMVAAYVEGVQGGPDGLSEHGVAAVVKHWVGYGAAPEGFDGHNAYGQHSSVTDDSLQHHIEPFLGAFDVSVAGVMPTYTITHQLTYNGLPVEQVAGGFSQFLVQTLLREVHGFNGYVLSDWAIYRDATPQTFEPSGMQTPTDIAMPWGVESLGRVERIAKSINAGVDQLGGEEDVQAVLDAVVAGLVSIERIDEAAVRMLKVKFDLGLFDAPYVDEDAAGTLVGCKEHQQLADEAQRRALICLKKHAPVERETVVFVDLFSTEEAPEGATVLVRISSPREVLHPDHFFGARQHEGSLQYSDDSDVMQQLRLLRETNSIVLVVQMVRPAVITNLLPLVDGLYVDLGISDDVIVDAVTGGFVPDGRLPFRLPESMQEVIDGRSDVPSVRPVD
jgi:beta-glucosidase